MSELIIVAFPDEATAFEARAELVQMQKEYLIEMEDVVIVTRSETGEVTLHQAMNLTAGGAVGGSIWGALVGLLFLNPIIGAAVGAGAGALAGRLSDIGINDDFLRNVGQSLDKGGAAVGVLLRKMTADKVMDRMATFRAKGRIVQTSLSHEAEERLRAVLEPVAVLGVSSDQLGGGKG